MRRQLGSWLLAGGAALAAANACVVPEFKSDGRIDGSGGEGGDGSDQSTGSGGVDGSGGAQAGGTGGQAQGDGGTEGDGGGPPGDGGTEGDGGNQGDGGTPGGGGAGGSGGTGGVIVGEGPSDLPAPPGRDDVPPPDGAPGDITVLNWAGFPAAVTYSFDDNDASQLDHYDELHALGGRYTFLLVTGTFGVSHTDPRWETVFEDGHEIGNHTDNHSCDAGQVEIAQDALTTTFGKAPTTLGAPNGLAACQSQALGKVFLNRHINPQEPILPLDDTNPFQLNAYIPATNQAASTFNANIDAALNQHGWIIYLIHGFASPAYQPLSWTAFADAVVYARDNDVWIDTLENVGAYWLGQKVFADALTTTNGDSTTWTWTLPDQFPAEKYLRVTVEGGTLTQEDESLVWDPHGYYEIALGVGSVTLGP